MSIWNRVTYPERKMVLTNIRDTGIVTFCIGICAFCITESVSKIVSIAVA